jgi:hypothetical protein
MWWIEEGEGMLHDRRVLGAIFGGWIGLIYALGTYFLNRLAVPGIPLGEPMGGLALFLFGNVFGIAVMGMAAAWPTNSFGGAAIGGLIGATTLFITSYFQNFQSYESVVASLFITALTFLPLAALLIPVAWLLRFAVEALYNENRVPFFKRPIWRPMAITVLAVAIATFSMYDAEVRKAFVTTQKIMEAGMQASSQERLPANLRFAYHFHERAQGRWVLEYTDRAELYTEQHPASYREMSDFLILAKFDSGYVAGCYFAPDVYEIVCADVR